MNDLNENQQKVLTKSQGNEEFLRLVKEKKDILFGKFSPKLTYEMKRDAWTEIGKRLVCGGAIQFAEKDWEGLRSTYGDMKRRTLERKRKRQLTGTGGIPNLKVKINTIRWQIKNHSD